MLLGEMLKDVKGSLYKKTTDWQGKDSALTDFLEDLTEGSDPVIDAVNHLGEKTYQTYAAWKAACKAINPSVQFEGDQDICQAKPGIGEWDGAEGVVYTKDAKPIGTPAEQERIKTLSNQKEASLRGGDPGEAQEYQDEIDKLEAMISNRTGDSSDYDKKMSAKGYKYKIQLPPGQGEDLYAKDFTSAKEMAKEYGKGTKVTELTADCKVGDITFGGDGYRCAKCGDTAAAAHLIKHKAKDAKDELIKQEYQIRFENGFYNIYYATIPVDIGVFKNKADAQKRIEKYNSEARDATDSGEEFEEGQKVKILYGKYKGKIGYVLEPTAARDIYLVKSMNNKEYIHASDLQKA